MFDINIILLTNQNDIQYTYVLHLIILITTTDQNIYCVYYLICIIHFCKYDSPKQNRFII